MPTATLVAAPAPAPEPERHSLLQSILYSLLPGLGPLLCILLVGRLMPDLPILLHISLGAFLGVMPVQLGILYYLGHKRNGRLSLEGIVLFREKLPVGKLLPWSLLTLIWAILIFMLAAGPLDSLLLPFFQWLPPVLQPITEDPFAAYSTAVGWTAWLVGLVGTAWLAPAVEELYFRGFLLPRMQNLKGWAPLVNALLFSLYHYWSPWQNLTRILAVTPMVFGVQRTKSISVSLWTHCLLNTGSTVMLLPFLLS